MSPIYYVGGLPAGALAGCKGVCKGGGDTRSGRIGALNCRRNSRKVLSSLVEGGGGWCVASPKKGKS